MIRHLFFALSLLAVGGIFFTSCCSDGRPDLRVVSENFPASANVNQTFQLAFTVQNSSTTDCTAESSTQCQVNLKMVKRETQQVQVDNYENMNSLSDGQTQVFTFSVVIGPDPGPGVYDLTFTIDPFNTSNDAIRENNTYTSVVIIN